MLVRENSPFSKFLPPPCEVELKWKERAVEVDGNVAFQQGKKELGGSFTGAFSGLTLP